MSGLRVCVASAQVPFESGGAERLAASLEGELRRRGHATAAVQLPFKWYPRAEILRSCLAWRLLDLSESDHRPVDLLIATKFPSYVVRHPRKVVWLVHQLRQVYDQLGTPYSNFGDDRIDLATRTAVRRIDGAALAEATRVYAIAENVAARLRQYNGVVAEVLRPPPRLAGQLRPGPYGDYLLAVSRLSATKRLDLLLRALALAPGVRCRIAGAGPEEERLRRLIAELDLADRVTLLGRVDDAALLDLYAGCFAVAYVPFDEDYGLVAVEALAARKPVITVADAGGVRELVRDGETGRVAEPSPAALAARIGELAADRAGCARLGAAGYELVRHISWDDVVEKLTSTAGAAAPASAGAAAPA